MSRLRVAVIGVGHLGKEHARILAGLPGVDLVGVADVNPAQAAAVAQRCGTRAYADHRALLNEVDAVTVVVPTTEHFAVARDFLRRGVPVLVEKPITRTLAEADELIRLAERGGVLLQVGHIERFNPAFEELLRRPMQPKFVECERHGPFTGRSLDIGAVLDLMIHDLDLLLTLAGEVAHVEAFGASVFGGHEDVVNARLRFAGGCVAHVTASRVSHRPKRRMRIFAPEGYAGVDFLHRRLRLVQPAEALRLFGLQAGRLDAAARAALKDEVFSRYLEVLDVGCNEGQPDQLTNELKHFLDCVRTGRQPRVTGADGRAALALAERVLAAVEGYAWEGRPDGPVGPNQLPRPLGRLFERPGREAA